MSRSYPASRHPTRRGPPFTPYALVVAGLVTFCIAVLAPVADLSAGLTVMNVAVSGATPAFDGGTLVLSGGLLLISAASTFFGVLLLLLRL
ncbi:MULTISPECIES: hypothetical protein [Haloferax]|uniref:Uncharacterized protein n=6 Tax=Haloferax TaxID=2251 RepID=D4GVV4_HALVD|nr:MULTISPECIES: hypothetical protein [Haloferax]ADE03975.1 uncharacterized protein HVO_2238 [Haloferax volcanii DS2]ELK56204.1 hypothetical protein D320_00658 [Haloferax sp. BAB-2207]ELY33464.1 hypothetical protein C498_06468 [Haloferax volcanii DS2]ELZ75630.1 hypothetical protein C456_05753 [Haloferax lucentense DSM 14919]ELZ88092.1 hypothetical protein C452_15020 [Haloferax alexandrinus JCM 10717]